MSRSAIIEALEGRRLLSVSPLATAPKISSMLGTFNGTQTYSSAVTYSVVIKVTRQRGRAFSGSVVESSGVTASIAGTINKKDAVRIVERGTRRHHFSSTIVGTLSTDTLTATFTKSAAGLKFHGSISATRSTTTSA